MQRRNFLQLSVATTSFLSLATPFSVYASADKKQVNVLVLGGGMAGLCASISAKQNGAKNVLLCEKGGFLGGHTILSGSGYWVGGTKIQKAAGIDDSLDINWQDSLDRGLKLNRFLKRNPEVARQVYEQGPKDLEWLESLGVRFTDQPAQAIGNRKRVHYFAPGYRVGSPEAIKALQKKAESLGVKIVLNTKLLSLITDGEKRDARVIGAIVEDNKGQKTAIYADQGVVLATGGFANGPEMVEKYHPYLKGVKSHGSKLNVGEGIEAATALGANVLVEHYGFGMNMLFVGTHSNVSIGQPLVEVPLIVVNNEGQRFQDETKGYLAVNHKMVEKKYKLGYWILDSKSVEKYKDTSLKILFEKQKVNKYSSLRELAEGEKINFANLEKTIREYNEDVEKGTDRYQNRTKLLQTIDKGPFYAFECEPQIYTSYTGLEINKKAQVMTTAGKPIEGLYAAGDVTGHLAYQVGLGGGGISGIVMATVYGRIAGEQAAKNKTATRLNP